MRNTGFKNDMTMMYVMHDALRRELRHLTRITADPTRDPRDLLRGAVGWEMFTRYLHVHHGAEDDVLWPAIRPAVADRPDELAVLDAMDAEHAMIDPGLAAFAEAVADRDAGPERLAAIVARLVTGLGAHLDHEEKEGLAVVDAHATPELLQRFGAEHGKRLGGDVSRYFPWLLEDAAPEDVEIALRPLPEPVRQAFHQQWRPAFAALDRWGTKAA